MANDEPWQRLYRYWQSRHVNGRVPGRRDIDPPLDVPELIANVMLIDVVGDRFRYRLVGSGLWDRYRQELTGTWIESRSPPETAWRDTLILVRGDLAPRMLSSPVPDHEDRSHVAIAMPLLNAAGQAEMILAGTFFAQEFGNNLRISGRLTIKEVLEG